MGSIPGALLHFSEIPGMAFAAREVAAGLVDGKVVFRAGQVNRCYESIYSFVFML
jgi:hypothetical protein